MAIMLFQNKFALSREGSVNLIKGIVYSVLVNLSLMIPVGLIALAINLFMSHIFNNDVIADLGLLGYILSGIVVLSIIFILHYFQ